MLGVIIAFAIVGWALAGLQLATLYLHTHCAHCRQELHGAPLCDHCSTDAGGPDDDPGDGEPYPDDRPRLRIVGKEAA